MGPTRNPFINKSITNKTATPGVSTTKGILES